MRRTVRSSHLVIVVGLLFIFGATMNASAQDLPQNPDEKDTSEVESVVQNFLPAVVGQIDRDTPRRFIDHAGQRIAYKGAVSCQQCHATEVEEFANSNHYMWEGKFGSINDFCEYPDINFGPGKLTTVFGTLVDGGCSTCHAGMGELPTAENEENADCLTCHAVDYRRTLAKQGEVWRFVPNYNAMPAVITIQEEPTRAACLTCHAYSGGGANNKRGDISTVLANPTEAQDVHMGNGMTCVDCHLTESHHIAGRGVDLRIDEGVEMKACTDCHNPYGEHDENVLRHLDTVACQSCHIPEFARAVSTDVHRDFTDVEVNARGLYEPVVTRQSNVTPVYGFWNGGSGFYDFLDPAISGQLMAWPLGDINDGKLFPFRLHEAVQPYDPFTQAIIAVKSKILFETGNIDLAIRVGAEETGLTLPEGYDFVDTQRYMGIFHEMPPAEQVLECAECHDSTDRVDFSALGYDPVDQRNGEPLCSSCHEPEEPMNFYQLHDKHVKDKDISCDTCHTFSRD
jgi:hypothetical protein